jgi:hypothetical protein
MMKPPASPALKRIGVFLLVLLLAQMACSSGVNPSDPNIPPSISPYLPIFSNYISYLKGLPPGQIPQPLILDPHSPAVSSGPLTIHGLGPSLADVKSSAAPVVNLYAVAAVDCAGQLTRAGLLGSAAVGQNATDPTAARQWQIAGLSIPAAVHILAATLTIDGQEGPYSDLLVVNVDSLVPTFTSPAPDQAVGRKITITGKAYPGLCLSVYYEDSLFLDQDIAPAPTDPTTPKDWSLPPLAVHEGQSRIMARIKGVSAVPAVSLAVNLQAPKITWPFGTKENGSYTPNPAVGCVTAWSGTNDFHINTRYPVHNGIDLDCAEGSTAIPVRAAADGIVYVAHTANDRDTGLNVAVDHGAWVSWYMHLAEINVAEGDTVTAGDQIGVMGTTGNSTGVHLHLQIFWWGDESTKAAFITRTNNSDIVIQPGSEMLTLNKPDTAYCGGSPNLWTVDWNLVRIINMSGTKFSSCATSGACTCPGK